MLHAYRGQTAGWQDGSTLSDGVIWIDLINPTEDEKRAVENVLKVHIPSQTDLSEIQASSRLTFHHDALYLSSPMVKISDAGDPELTPLGFILGKTALVTVRFSPLPIFDIIVKRMDSDDDLKTGVSVFTALLEAMIDRGADVLEQLGAETDKLSRSIFKGNLSRHSTPMRENKRLRAALGQIGGYADHLAKARDVFLGIGRTASFANDVAQDWITGESKQRIGAVLKDVESLLDYETRLSDKIQLLLDAVLGFINIEQNTLFKILTIVSVVGVPPTLLAGIWGMNFKVMPELQWQWGYPMAWLAIIASALLPLVWFKIRGWFD